MESDGDPPWALRSPGSRKNKMKELGDGKSVSRKLSPGSVETIGNGLFYYRTDRPAWIERYFPAIAQRGDVDYEDFDEMSEAQEGGAGQSIEEGRVYGVSKVLRGRRVAS